MSTYTLYVDTTLFRSLGVDVLEEGYEEGTSDREIEANEEVPMYEEKTGEGGETMVDAPPPPLIQITVTETYHPPYLEIGEYF